MKESSDAALNAIVTMSRLQDFAMKLAHIQDDIEGYDDHGDDIMPLLKKMKIDIPDIVGVAGLIRVDESKEPSHSAEGVKVVTLVGPDKSVMQQRTRSCWRPKGKNFRVCIECGGSKACSIIVVTDTIIVVTPQP